MKTAKKRKMPTKDGEVIIDEEGGRTIRSGNSIIHMSRSYWESINEPTARRISEERARQSLKNLGESDQRILELWVAGEGIGAIADKTGISSTTAARRLKKIQRMLVEGLMEEIDEITGRMSHSREEIEKLKEETRSNISELQRMIAA